MKDVNRITLVGRLGTDPIRRETKKGLAVTQFPLATSRWSRKEGDEEDGKKSDTTVWHRVVVWGKQAETCALYLKKGRAVYVEGSLQTRKYDGKEGQPRIAFEVHAEAVSFLTQGAKKSSSDLVESPIEASA